MEYNGPTEAEAIRGGLRTAFSSKDSATHILFDGSVIGQMVARPEPGSPRTLYIGLIEWRDQSIKIEAKSSSRLLKKLATLIAQSLTQDVPPPPELDA